MYGTMKASARPQKQDATHAIEVLHAEKHALKKFGVAGLWLFGSRVQGGAGASSDWDFLVEFDSPPGFDRFMGLKVFLEEKLQGPVDLLSRSACKPRFLQAINGELRNVA